MDQWLEDPIQVVAETRDATVETTHYEFQH